MIRKVSILVLLLAPAVYAGGGASLIGRAVPELMIEKWDLPESTPAPRMHDLRGKVVAILLFQAACGACHSSGFPLFQEFEKQLGTSPDLVTLYVQTPFEMLLLNGFGQGQAMVKRYGVKGRFAQDRQLPGSVVPGTFKRFRADGTPWVVLVDRAGTVQFAGYPEPQRGMVEKLRGLLAQPAPSGR